MTPEGTQKLTQDHVLKNYPWVENDTEETALNNLGKNYNIAITKSNKGGGVVIKDKVDYNKKMTDL